MTTLKCNICGAMYDSDGGHTCNITGMLSMGNILPLTRADVQSMIVEAKNDMQREIAHQLNNFCQDALQDEMIRYTRNNIQPWVSSNVEDAARKVAQEEIGKAMQNFESTHENEVREICRDEMLRAGVQPDNSPAEVIAYSWDGKSSSVPPMGKKRRELQAKMREAISEADKLRSLYNLREAHVAELEAKCGELERELAEARGVIGRAPLDAPQKCLEMLDAAYPEGHSENGNTLYTMTQDIIAERDRLRAELAQAVKSKEQAVKDEVDGWSNLVKTKTALIDKAIKDRDAALSQLREREEEIRRLKDELAVFQMNHGTPQPAAQVKAASEGKRKRMMQPNLKVNIHSPYRHHVDVHEESIGCEQFGCQPIAPPAPVEDKGNKDGVRWMWGGAHGVPAALHEECPDCRGCGCDDATREQIEAAMVPGAKVLHPVQGEFVIDCVSMTGTTIGSPHKENRHVAAQMVCKDECKLIATAPSGEEGK